MIRQVVTIVAAAIAVPYVLNQVRKPSRWVGRLFLWSMNVSHAGLTNWGLQHARIEKDSSILDVGCGGGRTIRTMAEVATEGRLFGVDYSAGSVDASRATNARLIQAGRVEIHQASVSRLPFPDATFDLVTAVETHYYWPDLPGDAREVLRVLKPSGQLVVIAETYKGGGHDPVTRLAMKALRAALLSADEHREWLASAGFSEVEVFEEKRRGWICVSGKRPPA